MQASVPELTDISKEPESTWKMYGEDARNPASFAQSCLMARRLVERGVRFVQVYHRGWDVHGNLPEVLPSQCKDIDQACWALVQDLKQRGMLDDTLVIWGGEFGRTIYSQGKLTQTDYGRDHHPRCFSLWMAGGGIKGGVVHGETDDFSYNITSRPGARARFPRHDPAPVRHRPRALHVPIPGARSEAYRRREGGGGQGTAGVI